MKVYLLVHRHPAPGIDPIVAAYVVNDDQKPSNAVKERALIHGYDLVEKTPSVVPCYKGITESFLWWDNAIRDEIAADMGDDRSEEPEKF